MSILGGIKFRLLVVSSIIFMVFLYAFIVSYEIDTTTVHLQETTELPSENVTRLKEKVTFISEAEQTKFDQQVSILQQKLEEIAKKLENTGIVNFESLNVGHKNGVDGNEKSFKILAKQVLDLKEQLKLTSADGNPEDFASLANKVHKLANYQAVHTFQEIVEKANAEYRKGNPHYKSYYECLGKSNYYEQEDRRGRSCMFKNVCYNTSSQDFYYYQPVKEPVFYDRKKGPVYSFNDGIPEFINVSPFSHLNTGRKYSFTPKVVIGEPNKEDAIHLKDFHALWAIFAYEHNMGHFVYEEMFSVYMALRRFGITTKDFQLLNMHISEDPDNALYTKFLNAFSPIVTNSKSLHLDTYAKSKGKPLVCFNNLLVASGSSAFNQMYDDFSEGKEALFWDYRAELFKQFNMDPYVRAPNPRKIVLLKKTESLNNGQQRTHFRDIYNLDQVLERLKLRFPDAPVEVYSPSTKTTIEEQVKYFSTISVIISPAGGISMALPFLPVGSHAIILDYYGSENDEMGYYHQSVSMESSFWNLWPHFHKRYYQVLTPEEMIPDIDDNKNYRWLYSVKMDLERVEYMVREALEEMEIDQDSVIRSPPIKDESKTKGNNNPISPTRVAMVTYFAGQKNESFHIWGDNEQYRKICHFTLQNIAAYTTHLSMPFFFENANMVDTVTSAYWGKMAVIEKYLVAGFEWVIWTDIDVIFLTEESLVTKWLDPAQANGKHVALLSECIDSSPANFGAVRSGFLAFRSTPEGLKFLHDWKTHSEKHLLEQSALEEMVTLEPWKSLIYIAPPDGLHTSPKCTHYEKSPISIHFAGFSDKVSVVEEYYRKSIFSQGDQDLLIEAAVPNSNGV